MTMMTRQMKTPFMYVNGIHFDSLTDLAWSKDGQHLIATSKDGYCTMLEFAPGELGEPLEHECLPPVVAKVCSLPVLHAFAALSSMLSQSGRARQPPSTSL